MSLVYAVVFGFYFAYPWLRYTGNKGAERARALDRERLRGLRSNAQTFERARPAKVWAVGGAALLAVALLGIRPWWWGPSLALVLLAWVLLTRQRVAEGRRTVTTVAAELEIAAPTVWGQYRYRSARRRRAALRVLVAAGLLGVTAIVLGLFASGPWVQPTVVTLSIATPVMLLIALVVSQAYFSDQTSELVEDGNTAETASPSDVAARDPWSRAEATEPPGPHGPSYLS